jgi:hypothetical protein
MSEQSGLPWIIARWRCRILPNSNGVEHAARYESLIERRASGS